MAARKGRDGVLLAAEELAVVGGEEAGDGEVDVQVAEGAVVLDVHASRGAVGVGVGLLGGSAPSSNIADFVGEPVAAAVVA